MTRDAAAELAGFKKMGEVRWVGMMLGFPVDARVFFGEMTLFVYVGRPVYHEQIEAVLKQLYKPENELKYVVGGVPSGRPRHGVSLPNGWFVLQITLGKEEPETRYSKLLEALHPALSREGVTPPETCHFCGRDRCDTLIWLRGGLRIAHTACLWDWKVSLEGKFLRGKRAQAVYDNAIRLREFE